jgi:hypothetical protein
LLEAEFGARVLGFEFWLVKFLDVYMFLPPRTIMKFK